MLLHILKVNTRLKFTGKALSLSSKQRVIQKMLKNSWHYYSFYITLRCFSVNKMIACCQTVFLIFYVRIVKGWGGGKNLSTKFKKKNPIISLKAQIGVNMAQWDTEILQEIKFFQLCLYLCYSFKAQWYLLTDFGD